MKKRRIGVLGGGLAILAVLAAAFLFLDFRLAVSNTHAEKNGATTSIGDQLPYAMQRRDKITLAVVGEGPLVRSLQKALSEELSKAGIGEIELVEELESVVQNPVLLIKAGNPGVIWTPFFASSQFSIQAGFASNGDARILGGTPVTVDNKNGPALNMSAEYKVSDRSWGIISRPGYYQILSEYLAHQIAEAAQNIYAAR